MFEVHFMVRPTHIINCVTQISDNFLRYILQIQKDEENNTCEYTFRKQVL